MPHNLTTNAISAGTVILMIGLILLFIPLFQKLTVNIWYRTEYGKSNDGRIGTLRSYDLKAQALADWVAAERRSGRKVIAFTDVAGGATYVITESTEVPK